MPRRVTPAGVRAGEPGALAGLIEQRGSAVLAYASAIVAPEAALEAAAQAMARFRSHVVGATDVSGLNPDAIVLRAVRESSAERVHQPAGSGGTLRRLTRRGGGACELAPRLLAARANRELSHEDAVRLDQHLASCPGCRAMRERFRDGERVYAESAGNRLRERDARALLLALAGAGPLAAATPGAVAAAALDLLPPEVVTRPDAFRGSAPATTQPESENSDAPGPDEHAPDSGPSTTTPGRVSFARHSAVNRSGLRDSGPEASEVAPPPVVVAPEPPPDETDDPPRVETGDPHERAADDWPPAQAREQPAPAEREPEQSVPEQPSLEPEHQRVETGDPHERAADDWPPAQAREQPAPVEPEGPEPQPQQPVPEQPSAVPEQPAPEPEQPAPEPEPRAPAPGQPAPETRDPRLAPVYDGGAGSPPDPGTLARVLPGVLIAMAIGIALLVAGIVGAGNTPATTDDIDPPSLREPAR